MDCEKFEATMLDELYGELDELTLAASRRHVAGCARCSALMAGFRATRKLVTLPVLSPSAGFESRLLSAVHTAEMRAAPKVSFANVLSWAGAWAMRPSTQMAAVFLLIIGTSSVFLSRRAPRSAIDTPEASFRVTENGSPAASAAPAQAFANDKPSLDPQAAAAAHGASPQGYAAQAAAPLATAPPGAFAKSAEGPAALEDQVLDQSANVISGGKVASGVARQKPRAVARGGFDDAVPGSLGALGHAGGGGLGELKGSADQQFAPPPPPPAVSAPAKDGLAAAKAQYNQRDFDGAARSFDALAAGGDPTAALWAARSIRDGSEGCAVAAGKFDQVANAAWGSTAGYDATLDAANCYARLGQADAARSRYNRLLTVPAYASRGQSGISATSQVATKARASAPKAAAASPAAAAPAAPPPAASTAPADPK